MRAAMRQAWNSRSPLAQALVAGLAVLLAIVLYVSLVHTAGKARNQLQSSVTALRSQAARLDQQALEYGRLRALPAATASATDLRSLVQGRAAAAGIARALARIDAKDADQVGVVFGAVPFADWHDWITSLQSQRIRLEECRIEALSAPGRVSLTATLVRDRPR